MRFKWRINISTVQNNLSVTVFGQRHIKFDIQVFIGWIGGPWP